MISSEETVVDLPGPEELVARDARSAYAELLRSLRTAIHFGNANTESAFQALVKIGEAWAISQSLEIPQPTPLPLSTPGERDVIQTLLALASYTQRGDETIAELTEAFRQITTTR